MKTVIYVFLSLLALLFVSALAFVIYSVVLVS